MYRERIRSMYGIREPTPAAVENPPASTSCSQLLTSRRFRQEHKLGRIDPAEYTKDLDQQMVYQEEERKKKLRETQKCWKEALAKLPKKKSTTNRSKTCTDSSGKTDKAIIFDQYPVSSSSSTGRSVNDHEEQNEQTIGQNESPTGVKLPQVDSESTLDEKEIMRKLIKSNRELVFARLATYRNCQVEKP